MQGQHHFQPMALVGVRLEDIIPANHLLRKINSQVDFGFLRALTATYYCQTHGRPSIDPEVFFRMLLIGYLYSIPSERRLCEEVQYNLAYRWFCKLNMADKVPDHSSLTKIRERLGVATFEHFL